MRKQELFLLENIAKIEQKQTYLLEKCKTPQQQFLQIFGQRHLLSKKMLHKNIEEALAYLKGSFGSLALRIAYMTLCLENHIELVPEDYPIIKILIDWAEVYPTFKNQEVLNITKAVFQIREINTFTSLQEYITYVSIISVDITKMVRRPKGGNQKESSPSNADFVHLNKDNLIQYVSYSLPKILINILLPQQVIPPEFIKKVQTLECLYKNTSLQYFLRLNQQYGLLMKTLIKILLTFEWNKTQQKFLMDIVFRYFFIYHHDKKYSVTDIFLEAYNKLSDAARLSLTDEINLFFRIVRKIGKGKFVDFLIQKSEWLQEITKKVNEKSLIGHVKDKVSPYNLLGLAETIVIESGKIENRYFQILEDYSIFYFRIGLQTLDVTIRLYYLGDICSPNPQKTLLMQEYKRSGQFSLNVTASKKGLYMFELDNSYSWMNSKSVRYENVVLTPLEMQAVDRYKWINSFYGGIPLNQMTNKEKVWMIQNVAQKKQKPKQQKKKEEEGYAGTANITKKNSFYNMKIVFPHQVYEFQSENEDIFVGKFNQWVDTNQKIKWLIAGEPIDDTDNIKGLISQTKQQNKKESKPVPKKEKIDAKYEDQDQVTEQKHEKINKIERRSPKINQAAVKANQKREVDKIPSFEESSSPSKQKQRPQKNVLPIQKVELTQEEANAFEGPIESSETKQQSSKSDVVPIQKLEGTENIIEESSHAINVSQQL